VLLVSLSLAGVVRAEEKAPPIRDDANLFSAPAITKALAEISEIRETYHRDVVIETIKELPSVDRHLFKFLWSHELHRRMEQQARERAQAAGVDGILILICTEPRVMVEAVAWPPSHGRFFSSRDAKELREAVGRLVKEKRPDQALAEAIRLVRHDFESNLADRQRSEPANEWFLAAAGGIFVGFWLVLRVARRRLEGADPTEPPELTTALLASRYGSVTGYWLYDKLFLAYRTALPGPPVLAPKAAAEVPADEDAASASVESIP
jgi:hypothetical protein